MLIVFQGVWLRVSWSCSPQPLMNTEALSGGHKSQGELSSHNAILLGKTTLLIQGDFTNPFWLVG